MAFRINADGSITVGIIPEEKKEEAPKEASPKPTKKKTTKK